VFTVNFVIGKRKMVNKLDDDTELKEFINDFEVYYDLDRFGCFRLTLAYKGDEQVIDGVMAYPLYEIICRGLKTVNKEEDNGVI